MNPVIISLITKAVQAMLLPQRKRPTDSTGGTKPAAGAPAAGNSGHQATGTAPEADGTK